MNNITFGNGFHLNPYTMDYIVKTLREPIIALAKSDTNYVVSGMKVTAPVGSNITISEGFAVISGVLYHFAEQEGGSMTTTTKLKVQTTITNNTYKDGSSREAYTTTELVVDNTDGTITLSELLKNKFIANVLPTDRFLSVSLESGFSKYASTNATAVYCGFVDVDDSKFQARILNGELLFEGVFYGTSFQKGATFATLSYSPGKTIVMPAIAYLVTTVEKESSISTTVTPYYVPVEISATGEMSVGRDTSASLIAFHGSKARL